MHTHPYICTPLPASNVPFSASITITQEQGRGQVPWIPHHSPLSEIPWVACIARLGGDGIPMDCRRAQRRFFKIFTKYRQLWTKGPSSSSSSSSSSPSDSVSVRSDKLFNTPELYHTFDGTSLTILSVRFLFKPLIRKYIYIYIHIHCKLPTEHLLLSTRWWFQIFLFLSLPWGKLIN